MKLIFLSLLFCLLTVACVPLEEQPQKAAETHYILGISFLREGDNTRALKEFLEAVEVAPQDVRIQRALAQTYQKKKAFELAEKHYLKALKLSKGNPEIQNNLGALYLDQGRWDEAELAFQTAANNLLFEHPELALTGVGVARFQRGDFGGAIEALKRAEVANRSYPPLYLYLGNSYFALKDLAAAEDAYNKAIRLAPEYLEARYRLGLLLLRMERRADARQNFYELYQLAPESSQAAMAKHYLEILK